MLPPTLPEGFLERMAEKFRMLGDSTRLAILRVLMEEEKSVNEVVDATSRGQANVSKHLKLLADAGLVARRKAGLQVFYRIDDPLVAKLCEAACASIVAESKAESDRHQRILDGWGQQT